MERKLYKPLDLDRYLKKHYPFEDVPKLTDKKRCLHCNKVIIVGSYWVELEYNHVTEKIEAYIVCPNAPECDGTVIDWIKP